MCQYDTCLNPPADEEAARIRRAEERAALERERRERIITATEASISDEAERRRAARARDVNRRNNRGQKREARGDW